MKRILAPALVLCGSLGCSQLTRTTLTSASEGRVSPNYPGPAEVSYCASVRNYASKVTVTGQAFYRRRVAFGTYLSGGLGSASLSGAHPAEQRPIRRAEVRVTDPGGYVVQCGVTDDAGAFVVDLPYGDVTYTIAVNSRAQHNLLNASVLNKPELNRVYSLKGTRVAVGSPAPLNLIATADGDVLGAAFNILDMIYEANRYLRAQVSSCGTTFDGCRNVNASAPLPKVSAYWEKGFNPNSYFGSLGGLSFYLPGYSRLFILGGEEGDVDHSDTDHFDNSVIVHEYGHFLEDRVGVSNSPGGSHNGNRVIDPRLAWSEGWGNFFQAAVLNQAKYVDTTGNEDGDTELTFSVNLETADDLTPETSNDLPENDGEGNYREFSVTRLLWDAVDATPTETVRGAVDNVSNRFPEIWAAFSSAARGFPFGDYAFRSVGLLHAVQRDYQARGLASDWSPLRQIERHDDGVDTYARFVQPGACAAVETVSGDASPSYRYALTPATVTGDTGTLSTSHLLLNNRFYHLKVTTAGAYDLTLDYADANRAGTKANLHLYLYNEEGRFGVATDIIARNVTTNQNAVGSPESKTVSAYLPVGDYLININVYTRASVGGETYYNLRLGSSQLCPGNLVPH